MYSTIAICAEAYNRKEDYGRLRRKEGGEMPDI